MLVLCTYVCLCCVYACVVYSICLCCVYACVVYMLVLCVCLCCVYACAVCMLACVVYIRMLVLCICLCCVLVCMLVLCICLCSVYACRYYVVFDAIIEVFSVPSCAAEYVSTMNREIISVVKALRKLDDIALKNPLSRIVALINKDILSRDKFVEVSPLFVSLFLRHHGVFYLCQALEMNRSSQFTDQAIM